MTSLEFKDITFSVSIGKRKDKTYKTILSKVNGTINAGEMVAIIGSSGAGKTTLINTLAGRIKDGKLSGEILFNGKKRVPRTFKRDAAYVEQDDLLFPDLTVRETLNYAASFRLSSQEYTPAQKKEIVDSILRSLRLQKAENTVIGDHAIKGVSGGERKRVSIGVEIITNPKLIMLDEPTTGLDSNSAEMVMGLVKELTFERKIISMASIHQPNFKTLRLFDKLVLLAPGGVVYFGPTLKAVEYFDSIGYKCPKLENPADFFIDIMTINTENETEFEKSTKQVENLKKKWVEYTQKHGYIYEEDSPIEQRVVEDKKSPATTIAENLHDANFSKWGSSWFSEFGTLLDRSWKRQLRNKGVLISHFLNSIVIMLIIGFVFFKKTSGFVAAQNKLGLGFLLVVNLVFPVIMPALSTLIFEKDVMTRERASGSYRISSFFSAIFLTNIPIALVTNTIMLTGVYFLAKFRYEVSKFFIFLAIYLSTVVCSVSFGFAMSSIASSLEIANILTPLVLSVYIIFGGIIVNADSVTPILSWLKYISYPYFSYMASMQNELTGQFFPCVAGANSACYPTGEAVLDSYSLRKFSILTCILINLGMAVGYNLIAYLVLRFKSKPKYLWV